MNSTSHPILHSTSWRLVKLDVSTSVIQIPTPPPTTTTTPIIPNRREMREVL